MDRSLEEHKQSIEQLLVLKEQVEESTRQLEKENRIMTKENKLLETAKNKHKSVGVELKTSVDRLEK